jgi:hypothetical protein
MGRTRTIDNLPLQGLLLHHAVRSASANSPRQYTVSRTVIVRPPEQ